MPSKAVTSRQLSPSEACPRRSAMPLSQEEQAQLCALLCSGPWGRRLLELVRHGFGNLTIIVADHMILKSHLTTTDI